MKNSTFYQIAIKPIDDETKKLEKFCAILDKDPVAKKNQLAEYKCAKYRYASVAHIYNLLYHGNRVYQKPAIHIDIGNSIENNEELFNLCNNAGEDEKIDFKLYYGISFLLQEKIAEYSTRLIHASDWEKIELEERIGGLQFAKVCLDEAWQKRKDVIA